MIDTLTGWVDGSPFWTKKGKEMVKKKKKRKKERKKERKKICSM